LALYVELSNKNVEFYISSRKKDIRCVLTLLFNKVVMIALLSKENDFSYITKVCVFAWFLYEIILKIIFPKSVSKYGEPLGNIHHPMFKHLG